MTERPSRQLAPAPLASRRPLVVETKRPRAALWSRPTALARPFCRGSRPWLLSETPFPPASAGPPSGAGHGGPVWTTPSTCALGPSIRTPPIDSAMWHAACPAHGGGSCCSTQGADGPACLPSCWPQGQRPGGANAPDTQASCRGCRAAHKDGGGEQPAEQRDL